jgi:hypothetical protein
MTTSFGESEGLSIVEALLASNELQCVGAARKGMRGTDACRLTAPAPVPRCGLGAHPGSVPTGKLGST